MANDQTVAPVIIKRKKIIAADGHHGGAWKVAYADFVTAIGLFHVDVAVKRDDRTTEKRDR